MQLEYARFSNILLAVVLTSLCYTHDANCLSTGAPGMACASMRPLHGLHRPRPASASQFFVTKSALGYGGGASDEITVELATHSSERSFRGFMVQAYDPSSGQPIGQFHPGPDARPIDGCSAATHKAPHNKRKVSLIWAPSPAGSNQASPNGPSLISWMGLGLGSSSGSASGAADGNQGGQSGSAQDASAPTNATAGAAPKQVRFRATIVVSYSEFYTGFESSELKFEKFNYSQANETDGGTSNTDNKPMPTS